jgi:pre-mRNA-processing factor 40
MILDDYVSDLRRREEDYEADLRKRNIDTLSKLIKTLDITVGTTWRQAHNLILADPTFKTDKDLAQIETVDMLVVFDDHMRQIETEHEEEEQKRHKETYRRHRKAREAFKGLLSDLEANGQLKRTSKWKDTVKLIRHDERYTNMLGIPGSTALELWMDAVDDLAEEIDRSAAKLEHGIDGAKLTAKTTHEEFEQMVKEAHLDTQVEPKMRKAAWELIRERLVKHAEDEARRAERKRRHRMDDLRYALKKVSRHIDLEMTFDEVRRTPSTHLELGANG